MHKNAEDLEVFDQFLMAGGHYTISHIYETVDDEKVKFAFHSRTDPSIPMSIMIVPKTMLFTTT